MVSNTAAEETHPHRNQKQQHITRHHHQDAVRCNGALNSEWCPVAAFMCLVCIAAVPYVVSELRGWQRPTSTRNSNNDTTIEYALHITDAASAKLASAVERTAKGNKKSFYYPPGICGDDPPEGATASPTTPMSLDAFRDMCHAKFKDTSRYPSWPASAVLDANHRTRGEGITCMQGRRLYCDGDCESTWHLSRGGLDVHPLTSQFLTEHQDVLKFRANYVVITTTLLSLYHMLNDFVLPWPHIVETVLFRNISIRRDESEVDLLRTLPMDYVLLHINNTLRGVGNDDISILALETLVDRAGGHRVKKLICDVESDLDPEVHCYCRTILQPPSGLFTYPPDPTVYIAEGDAARRRWTLRFKQSLNDRFGFVPLGTYPIDATEYAPYGLWPNHSISNLVPRLLLLTRKKNRLLGQVDIIVESAMRVGFHVQVTCPEEQSLALQARAARYADVIVGIHGAALTWVAMMDGTKATNCREMIELAHYGRKFKRLNNVYEVLAADSWVRYRSLPPIAVSFDPNVIPPQFANFEKQQLMKKMFPHHIAGFNHQTANYSRRAIVDILQRSYMRVSACVPRNTEVVLQRHELLRGELVWSPTKRKAKRE